MTTQLDIDEVLASLPSRGTWQVVNNRIVCEFRFPDFVQAFAFITQVAFLAEKAGHHPDIFNSYSLVRVELHTHDVGGITQRDVDLAHAIAEVQSGGPSAGGKN